MGTIPAASAVVETAKRRVLRAQARALPHCGRAHSRSPCGVPVSACLGVAGTAAPGPGFRRALQLGVRVAASLCRWPAAG